jgi:hypothetical protein
LGVGEAVRAGAGQSFSGLRRGEAHLIEEAKTKRLMPSAPAAWSALYPDWTFLLSAQSQAPLQAHQYAHIMHHMVPPFHGVRHSSKMDDRVSPRKRSLNSRIVRRLRRPLLRLPVLSVFLRGAVDLWDDRKSGDERGREGGSDR